MLTVSIHSLIGAMSNVKYYVNKGYSFVRISNSSISVRVNVDEGILDIGSKYLSVLIHLDGQDRLFDFINITSDPNFMDIVAQRLRGYECYERWLSLRESGQGRFAVSNVIIEPHRVRFGTSVAYGEFIPVLLYLMKLQHVQCTEANIDEDTL
jgi:hypothetical protein